MVLGPVLTVASASSSALDLHAVLKFLINYAISPKCLCFIPTYIVTAFTAIYCSLLWCLYYLEININHVQAVICLCHLSNLLIHLSIHLSWNCKVRFCLAQHWFKSRTQ